MNVQHDTQHHRFLVELPEGKGELVYEPLGPQVLDLQHTSVDGTLRGRGVGEALVEAAMKYIRSNGYKFVPTCTYVQRWLTKHPEQQDLVVKAGN
jgi:predicted GNAT family acetyltransferase